MTDESSSFDPRFDPAFQRGYDGPAPQAAPRRRVAKRTETPPDPIGMPPVGGAYVRAPLAEPRPVRATPSAEGVVEDEIVEVDAERRANPFLIVLAVVGVGIAGVGAALLANMATIFEQANSAGPNNQYDFYYLQTIMWGAPMLVCLGIATVVGVLFVLAVRWRR